MGAVSSLDPAIRSAAEWLIAVAHFNGLSPVVTSARRSTTWQAKKYRECQRRAAAGNPCPYPVAFPGTSKHERGLAFDLSVTPHSMLTPLGHLWESIGGRWGGRFRDPIHFEI